MQGVTKSVPRELVKETSGETRISPVQRSIGEVDREVKDREEQELRRFRAD
jgi:hypothetical protein